MGQTVQLVVVLAIVAVAAIYAGRRLLQQFTRSEDEAGGCAGCALNPAMQEKLRRQAAKARRRAARSGRAASSGGAGSDRGGTRSDRGGAQIVHLGTPRRS